MGRPGAVGPLILLGTVAAVVAVVAESRLGPRDPRTVDPFSWWGILPSAPPTETARGVLAGAAALGVITLCLCWWALVRTTIAGRVSAGAAVAAAVAWGLPFVLGPPLFSRDVYAYAAQGELARLGLDPATHGVSALRTATSAGPTFLAAVDPRWWDTHTPYGGAAVALERAAAALGGGPAGTVVLLRVVAVLATAALVVLTVRLAGAGRSRRALTLVLVGANPVVLIHLAGGAHLDATAGALIVAALLVDRRRVVDRRRAQASTGHPGRGVALGAAAVALATVAGSVKATAFLGLAWLVLAHLRDARAAGPRRLRRGALMLAADTLAAAAAALASMALAGFGPTWISALATSGTLTTGVAPATVLAAAVRGAAWVVGVHPSGGAHGTVQRLTRVLALAIAAVIVGWLARRAWRDRADRADPSGPAGNDHDLIVVGFGGMAVALANPVLYPWYLGLVLPALAVLVARAQPPSALSLGMRATVVLLGVTSIWLCLANLSPLAATWRLLGRAGPLTGGVAATGIIALGTASALLAARRRRARPIRTPGAARRCGPPGPGS